MVVFLREWIHVLSTMHARPSGRPRPLPSSARDTAPRAMTMRAALLAGALAVAGIAAGAAGAYVVLGRQAP
ncbi:hypothetical protein, partial [Vineibacter terrae]|uniref:hypothetical protein n=1 Tax=Vineibacter terrae TaxID=2586908 RepID=UPI002E317BA9